jgi:hypothetical protein
MTPAECEAKQALEAMKCPRCGARLSYRDVINAAGGRGLAINQDFGELFDMYGHSFNVKISDLNKKMNENN